MIEPGSLWPRPCPSRIWAPRDAVRQPAGSRRCAVALGRLRRPSPSPRSRPLHAPPPRALSRAGGPGPKPGPMLAWAGPAWRAAKPAWRAAKPALLGARAALLRLGPMLAWAGPAKSGVECAGRCNAAPLGTTAGAAAASVPADGAAGTPEPGRCGATPLRLRPGHPGGRSRGRELRCGCPPSIHGAAAPWILIDRAREF